MPKNKQRFLQFRENLLRLLLISCQKVINVKYPKWISFIFCMISEHIMVVKESLTWECTIQSIIKCFYYLTVAYQSTLLAFSLISLNRTELLYGSLHNYRPKSVNNNNFSLLIKSLRNHLWKSSQIDRRIYNELILVKSHKNMQKEDFFENSNKNEKSNVYRLFK